MTRESRRFINLNLYIRNSGYHESAWKVSPADPASVLDISHFIELARTAERGSIDSIFLPDSPGVAEFRSEFLPGVGFDPIQLLSSVATATDQVGLIATVSMTYSHPWDVARRLATLDFLSRGRAGWNIVTTVEPAAAGNFRQPTTFRAVAQKLSALPGGLDFTGTPEAMAQLISDWWQAGTSDGFTLMPNVLPSELAILRPTERARHIRRPRGANPATTRHRCDRVRGYHATRSLRAPATQLPLTEPFSAVHTAGWVVADLGGGRFGYVGCSLGW